MDDHYVFFEGSCHPPGKPDDYDGTFLRLSEMKSKLNELNGTPILNEHDNTKNIGEIVGARIDERGRLLVRGKIGRDSFHGIDAVHKLRFGDLKGLSLGLEHLIYKDPKWTGIIDKKINEVSLTNNPDLPETEVLHVEPDTKRWTTTRSLIKEQWENQKLKKDVYKSSSNLFNLIDRCRKGIMDSASIPKDLAPPPSNSTAEQQQIVPPTTTPPPATPTPTSSTSTNTTPLSKRELEKKLQDTERENSALLELHGRNEALLQEYNKDPAQFQKYMLEKQEEEKREREKMEKDVDPLLDFATNLYQQSGQTIPAELADAIKTGHNHAESFKPLHSLLTVAHAGVKKSQTEAENAYQEMKKKDEEMSRRLDYEKQAKAKLEAQWERERKEEQYRSSANSRPLPYTVPSSNPPRQGEPPYKKRRLEEEETSDSFGKRWEPYDGKFDLSNATKKYGNIRPIPAGGGMHDSEDHRNVWFKELFSKSREIPYGQEMVEYAKSVSGKLPKDMQTLRPQS